MSYIGKVENGVVVLPPEAKLPEGSEVRVERVEAPLTKQAEAVGESFYDRYKEFIGVFKDLPSDLAENHDHYIHGTPKRTKTN